MCKVTPKEGGIPKMSYPSMDNGGVHILQIFPYKIWVFWNALILSITWPKAQVKKILKLFSPRYLETTMDLAFCFSNTLRFAKERVACLSTCTKSPLPMFYDKLIEEAHANLTKWEWWHKYLMSSFVPSHPPYFSLSLALSPSNI